MADCTCAYIEATTPTGRRCVWRDPRCPIHFETVPQYDQAGRLRPVDEYHSSDEGKHGGCG